MQIRGRKPKKQPIRAGGISASPPQATRGCAARCRGFAAFACARETQQYRQLRRLGHSQRSDCADLDTSFHVLKKVHLNPKSKIRVENLQKSASIFSVLFFSKFSHLVKH